MSAVVVVARAARRRRTDRDDRQQSDDLIETIDILLATLRAGYSLHQSLTMLADIAPLRLRPTFSDLRINVDAGTPVPVALNHARLDLGPAFGPLIGLVISAHRLGIPSESLIGQIRSEARIAQRHHAEMLARQLSVRVALPLVLCTLPSFIFMIIVPTVAGTMTTLHLSGDTP